MAGARCPDNVGDDDSSLGIAVDVRVTTPALNMRPVDTNDSERYTELVQVKRLESGKDRIIEFDPVRGKMRVTYIPNTTFQSPYSFLPEVQERVFRAVEVVA